MKVGDLVMYTNNRRPVVTNGVQCGNIGLIIGVLKRDKSTFKVRWFSNGEPEFWTGQKNLKILTKE